MIKAIIFDRDGVIIDSEATHVNSMISAFKNFDIELETDEKEYIAGRRRDDYLPPLCEKYSVTFDDIRRIQKEKFIELFETATYFPETIKFLKNAHKSGLLIGMATSANPTSTDIVLEKAGIKHLFNVIVSNEDVTNTKPDPEPYLLVSRKLGIKPTECIVIEDSGPGLQSAKSAGMKCIIIYNKYTKNHDFSLADLVVKSAKHINLLDFIN